MESDPPFQEKYKSLFANVMEQSMNPARVYEKNHFIDNEFELPLIDLSRLGLSDHDRKECKREVARAARKLGLFQVVNHGISGEILARMKCEQQKLFWQPFQKKVKEKFLDTSTEYYHWGNPNATSLMQFSWSEGFHIPLNHIQMWKEYNSTLRYVLNTAITPYLFV